MVVILTLKVGVILFIVFMKRELNFINQGKEIMQNFCDMLEGVQIDKTPKMEGKNLTMFISPSKNK